tara:strand:- start:808 stop:1005 length:198 start_codon:yes stop_codon:yes gene_type:complete
MPNPLKILTYDTREGCYICYLTLDDQVEMTIYKSHGKVVGTRLSWNELPWEVRASFEDSMDPHNL